MQKVSIWLYSVNALSMNTLPRHLGQVNIMRKLYHVGMPIARRFTDVETCPDELNFTTPSILDVVTDLITTVTSSPMSDVPRFTTVAVTMGGYLKSDE